METVVAPIIGAIAAATICGYLVGFYKKAAPDANGKTVMLVAIAAGQLAAVLETAMLGQLAFEQVQIATMIAKGIIAAAVSAGVQATNQSGDSARIKAGTKDQPVSDNQVGQKGG